MTKNERDKIKETVERLNQILNSDYLDGLVSYWQDKSACQIFKADIRYLISALQKEELDEDKVFEVLDDTNDVDVTLRDYAKAICQQFKPKQFERGKIKEAYECGYERGHNDTVESCYGYVPEKAEEYLNEIGENNFDDADSMKPLKPKQFEREKVRRILLKAYGQGLTRKWSENVIDKFLDQLAELWELSRVGGSAE